MTYLESAEGIQITKARAFAEFKKHGMTFEDFDAFLLDIIADHETTLCPEGNIQTLSAQACLEWLGY